MFFELQIKIFLFKLFDFSNSSTKWKYYDNSNELVIGKMKDESAVIGIKEFVGLKPKMFLFFRDNTENEKAKSVNRNVTVTTSHNEYKDVFLIINV